MPEINTPTSEQYSEILRTLADMMERIGDAEENIQRAMDALDEASAFKDNLMELLFIVARKDNVASN